jgi:hypothetical protein
MFILPKTKTKWSLVNDAHRGPIGWSTPSAIDEARPGPCLVGRKFSPPFDH